jgi:hypothetical protein
MKQCPQCKRTFTDETTFCLDDGTRLQAPYDPQATLILPESRLTNAAPIVVPPPQSLEPQIIRQGVRPAIVYGLVALLALVIGGGAVALFYERGNGSGTSDNSKQAELPPVASPVPTPSDAGKNVQTIDQPTPEGTPRRESTNSNIPGKYPEASTRLLNSSDVAGKSSWELKIMKNEIYARRGYIFKTPELKSYFESQPWYKPLYDDVTDLISNIERENAAFIKGYE